MTAEHDDPPVVATWESWDRSTVEHLSRRWERGGWTVEGLVAGIDVHYVVRLNEDGTPRQFLLFRDLEDPDLWLATTGAGRWGEVNGAERPDLSGCSAVALASAPGAITLALLSVGVAGAAVGDAVTVHLAAVHPDTLDVEVVQQRLTRLDERRWRLEVPGVDVVELDVDAHGLVLDLPGRFRRLDGWPS